VDDSPAQVPPVRRDFEPDVEIDLEPVDSVVVTTLMDNVTDNLMPDQGPARLDDLTAMDPGVLVPAHCTGWRAQHAMSARFPSAFVPNAVGTSFHL
jgi:hypothetical protein